MRSDGNYNILPIHVNLWKAIQEIQFSCSRARRGAAFRRSGAILQQGRERGYLQAEWRLSWRSHMHAMQATWEQAEFSV